MIGSVFVFVFVFVGLLYFFFFYKDQQDAIYYVDQDFIYILYTNIAIACMCNVRSKLKNLQKKNYLILTERFTKLTTTKFVSTFITHESKITKMVPLCIRVQMAKLS